MNTLLIVIGMHTGDAAQAEKLCDCLFLLHGRKPVGHALIVADAGVHEELQVKVKLAAEVAFESSELIVAPPFERVNKPERTNHLFRSAAAYISQHYRIPWVWLEPDCVPLKKTWLVDLSLSYHSQPKRYMGPFLKTTDKEGKELVCLSRNACYPPDAILDIAHHCDKQIPFNIAAGDQLTRKATKSKLFQQIAYNHETDHDKIRADAVLLHCDKTGALLRLLAADNSPKAEPVAETAVPDEIPAAPRPRGRPRLNPVNA